MNPKIWTVPLTDPVVDEAEVGAASRVLRSKWLTMGAEVQAFEQEFAAAIGCEHAVAVANGTVALHLAYQAVGLREGDEFCVPALTFVATLHAGLYLGARPVLIDCASPDDLTLSADDLERKLSDKTRLIVTMPYGGFVPDMRRICELARQRDIPVVEDACHAPLAEWNGRKVGAFGAASTYSFYGNKNMTTGEGGMIVTDDADIAARLRLLRSHGMSSLTWDRHQGQEAGGYEISEVGYNYRLDEMRAAIGREQLRKLPESTERRRAAAGMLRAALAPAETRGLGIPFAKPRGRAAHHLFVVILPNGVDRDGLRRFLAEHGVQTSVHYPPMHRFPHVAAQCPEPDLPMLEDIIGRLVTLPMGPSLTEHQIQHVAATVDAALEVCGS